MSEKPLPGTKAAVDAGCLCSRQGWEWDWTWCSVHRPPEQPEPARPGTCEHGERPWSCGECADRQASYDAFVEDMRSIRPQHEDAFGRRKERSD